MRLTKRGALLCIPAVVQLAVHRSVVVSLKEQAVSFAQDHGPAGATIHAMHNSGHESARGSVHLFDDMTDIEQAVGNTSLPFPIFWFDEVSSTMDKAKELLSVASSAHSSSNHALLQEDIFAVVADRQTSGRGTRGRVWNSLHHNLLMTVCIRRSVLPIPLTLLPLRVGSILAANIHKRVSDSAASQVKLKWPNDVLIGEHKVCGILIEMADDYLLVGIGCNVMTMPNTATIVDAGQVVSSDGTSMKTVRPATSIAVHNVMLSALSRRLFNNDDDDGASDDEAVGSAGEDAVIEGDADAVIATSSVDESGEVNVINESAYSSSDISSSSWNYNISGRNVSSPAFPGIYNPSTVSTSATTSESTQLHSPSVTIASTARETATDRTTTDRAAAQVRESRVIIKLGAADYHRELAVQVSKDLHQWVQLQSDSAELVRSDFQRNMDYAVQVLRDEPNQLLASVRPKQLNPDGSLQVERVYDGKEMTLLAEYLW